MTASNEILAPTLVAAAPAGDADSRREGPNASGPRSGVLVAPDCSLAERYRIDGVLAEGGMATVYRAWHCLLDQPVALKMLRPEYSSVAEIAQRFLHEARAMARLRSRHAVRVMDFGGTVEGNPYMVLELLNGKDLQQLLVQEGAQPVERAVEFVLQAAEAVSEAHALGLVHRDIKPANLFLAKEDGTEIIKVIDFGISKSLCRQSEYRTLSKSYLGSPQYMSPEQIRSAASVDARTDIWSLGVVLYELLTGRPPFSAATLPALCASVVSDTPALPEHLPAQLRSVVMRCLAKRREDRYSELTELHEALARCLGSAGPEPLACPTSDPRPQIRECTAPVELPAPSSAPRAVDTVPRTKCVLRSTVPYSAVARGRARTISLVCGVTAFAAAAGWVFTAVSLPEAAKSSLIAPAAQPQPFEPVSNAQPEPVVAPAAEQARAMPTSEHRLNAVQPRELPPKASNGVRPRGTAKKPSRDRVPPAELARGDDSTLEMEARYALTYEPDARAIAGPLGPTLAAGRPSEQTVSEPALEHSGL